MESPAKFADPAKNLLIVANIANFALRNVRTHHHFAIMVERKFLEHHVVPSADKLPFEFTERERDPVTFHALYPTYYQQDFNGLFYYDIGNVVGFIFISIHCAIYLRVNGFSGMKRGTSNVVLAFAAKLLYFFDIRKKKGRKKIKAAYYAAKLTKLSRRCHAEHLTKREAGCIYAIRKA